MDVRSVISLFKMKGLALAVLLATISTAAEATSTCWMAEENPVTRAPYSSLEEWGYDVQEWAKRRPGVVNPLSLIQAYSVYKTEQSSIKRFKNDKEVHCFFGCRISQATNYHTAQYVAWLKEDRDIKDCKMQSHFEFADYEATIIGADLGTSLETRYACAKACSEQF